MIDYDVTVFKNKHNYQASQKFFQMQYLENRGKHEIQN